jgi:hypothetical protein
MGEAGALLAAIGPRSIIKTGREIAYGIFEGLPFLSVASTTDHRPFTALHIEEDVL